jgi:Domain of unknown function (DUF222)
MVQRGFGRVRSGSVVSVAFMFDELVATATRSTGAGVGSWARVENAACARRLAAMADMLDAAFAADGSAEREQWCLDNWDAVAAQIGAAQNVSAGVASHELLVAQALRQRLPRVAEVFATGAITYRMVCAMVARTALIQDPGALTKVDAELAAHVRGWGSLSVDKTKTAIDYWVDRFDPGAVRRNASKSRDRHVDVVAPGDGSGLANIEAVLFAHDGAVLDQRLTALAATVCENDPRTRDQRRSDALAVLGAGADRLVCGCGAGDCPAATGVPRTDVVIHLIAHEDSLTDDTPAQYDGDPAPGPTEPAGEPDGLTEDTPVQPDGNEAPGPSAEEPDGLTEDTEVQHEDAEPQPVEETPVREKTIGQALAPRQEPAPHGPAATAPAAILGGAIIPAPLLAAKLANTAIIRLLIHPGDAPPEPRYTPSAKLADFVRCRDMTCRFPGCDEPAMGCDLDHTIPHPHGPTCASNLGCLCRKHHLLKTFGGWLNKQLPDGTMIWTAPDGQTYTTYPGSRILFPSLCRPTAPVTVSDAVPATNEPGRSLAMPRRTRTRAENRRRAIGAERRLNDEYTAERNKPPPF